ncbi:hypothetical protein BaRGS_00007168, partial [Batillaria attramentaria]
RAPTDDRSSHFRISRRHSAAQSVPAGSLSALYPTGLFTVTSEEDPPANGQCCFVEPNNKSGDIPCSKTVGDAAGKYRHLKHRWQKVPNNEEEVMKPSNMRAGVGVESSGQHLTVSGFRQNVHMNCARLYGVMVFANFAAYYRADVAGGMGVFGTIKSGMGGSPSILMIIVLGVADQLWGDNIFNCPCGTQFSRVLFTLPFLVVPPIIIITVDTPWRFVRTSFKCDMTLRCCRWIYRPIIIAVIWMVFSLLQPKFGSCMFTVESCACSEQEKADGCTEEDTAGKEKAAFTRVVAACIILGVGVLVFLVGLEDTVLAMELKTKTISKLRSKGLLRSSKQLAALTPEQLANMKSISAGQIEILRRFPQERLLMQTLVVMGLTPESVVKLREQGIADDRLADKLKNDDYKHIASVITKRQLKILRDLPKKWGNV